MKEMQILDFVNNEYEITDGKARPVNNVAEMKAMSNLVAGNIIKTIGYYSANDGGGATYLIREKLETDVEDLGAIHFINNNLVAELVFKNVIEIKHFGAKGDKETDDTIAIQRAIKFAEEKTGVLYINPGVYKITNELNINKAIKIYGLYEKGELSTPPYYYGSHIRQTTEGKNIFNFSGANDYYGVEISKIRFSGKKKGINIDTTGVFSEFIFEKIHFNGGFEECIYFENTGSIGRISDCDFSANKIGINANTLVSVTINDNNFWENTTAHIKFGSCTDLKIINNWFEKTTEEGCSLLFQAPFMINKCIFLNNDFRSIKTPIINLDGITNITEIAYMKNTVFENCRFSVGSHDYAIVVRMTENEVTNKNSQNSSKVFFNNCLFVNVKTSAIYTDYKHLYWNLRNCECYSSWTSGNKDIASGVSSLIISSKENNGFKTNGVLSFENAPVSDLYAVENVIFMRNDIIHMRKYGANRYLMPVLSGPTESRPTEKLTAGVNYFDTTLNKPIWYTGSKWVDSTGIEV